MGFRTSLEQICELEGAVLASVMGFDGIAIDTVTKQEGDTDTDVLLVELSALLDQVRKVCGVLETGGLAEVSIRAEELVVLLRPIDENYFLILAMRPQGNAAKGRYLLRVAAPRLRAEL